MNKAINLIVSEQVNQNSYARKFMTKKLESMNKYPSEAKAQELEEMGLSIDYKAGDEGMEPERHNFDNE